MERFRRYCYAGNTKILENMGEQIMMARWHRYLSTELVAQDDEFGRRIQNMNLVPPQKKNVQKGSTFLTKHFDREGKEF